MGTLNNSLPLNKITDNMIIISTLLLSYPQKLLLFAFSFFLCMFKRGYMVELRNKKKEWSPCWESTTSPQRELEEHLCQRIAGSCRVNMVIILGDFNFLSINWDYS